MNETTNTNVNFFFKFCLIWIRFWFCASCVGVDCLFPFPTEHFSFSSYLFCFYLFIHFFFLFFFIYFACVRVLLAARSQWIHRRTHSHVSFCQPKKQTNKTKTQICSRWGGMKELPLRGECNRIIFLFLIEMKLTSEF